VKAAVVWQRLAIQRQKFGLQPYRVTAMQTLHLENGYPLYGNDVHERWVGTRAQRRGRHSGSEVVSNVTVSVGHTVAKMLAVAYAESFHAGPGIRLVLAVKGRPRVATATTTPFFDPQDMRLRA
jgi:glycine cleavage system aminomethyltransferase T